MDFGTSDIPSNMPVSAKSAVNDEDLLLDNFYNKKKNDPL
jgi:hypothetical protein